MTRFSKEPHATTQINKNDVDEEWQMVKNLKIKILEENELRKLHGRMNKEERAVARTYG